MFLQGLCQNRWVKSSSEGRTLWMNSSHGWLRLLYVCVFGFTKKSRIIKSSTRCDRIFRVVYLLYMLLIYKTIVCNWFQKCYIIYEAPPPARHVNALNALELKQELCLDLFQTSVKPSQLLQCVTDVLKLTSGFQNAHKIMTGKLASYTHESTHICECCYSLCCFYTKSHKSQRKPQTSPHEFGQRLSSIAV